MELRIGDVAKQSGIATSAIRYYEEQGLLAAPPRRHGQRVYSESVVDQLALIDLAKRAGFTIAEIKKLQAGFGRKATPGRRWRSLTERKLDELDERIAEARRMKRVLRTLMDCDCPSVDACGRTVRARRERGPQRG